MKLTDDQVSRMRAWSAVPNSSGVFMTDEVRTLLVERDALRAALRPFAAIGDGLRRPFASYSSAAVFTREITQPQVAAARDALAEKR